MYSCYLFIHNVNLRGWLGHSLHQYHLHQNPKQEHGINRMNWFAIFINSFQRGRVEWNIPTDLISITSKEMCTWSKHANCYNYCINWEQRDAMQWDDIKRNSESAKHTLPNRSTILLLLLVQSRHEKNVFPSPLPLRCKIILLHPLIWSDAAVKEVITKVDLESQRLILSAKRWKCARPPIVNNSFS